MKRKPLTLFKKW